MKKYKNTLIFILSHKIPEDFDLFSLENSLCTILLVGTSLKKKKLFNLADNDIEDNISNENYFYSEYTGIYYIWKLLLNNPEWKDYKYIGQTTYRRELPISENTDFDKLFLKIDFFGIYKKFSGETLYNQFCSAHFKWVFDEIIEILLNKFPEYTDNLDKTLNSNVLYFSSGFILKREDYIDYCTFLFSILDEFKNRHKLYTEDNVIKYTKECLIKKGMVVNENIITYQRCMGGFIAERLFTIYVRHKFKKILKNIDYIYHGNLLMGNHKI